MPRLARLDAQGVRSDELLRDANAINRGKTGYR